jgi:hypothetical protein
MIFLCAGENACDAVTNLHCVVSLSLTILTIALPPCSLNLVRSNTATASTYAIRKSVAYFAILPKRNLLNIHATRTISNWSLPRIRPDCYVRSSAPLTTSCVLAACADPRSPTATCPRFSLLFVDTMTRRRRCVDVGACANALLLLLLLLLFFRLRCAMARRATARPSTPSSRKVLGRTIIIRH